MSTKSITSPNKDKELFHDMNNESVSIEGVIGQGTHYATPDNIIVDKVHNNEFNSFGNSACTTSINNKDMCQTKPLLSSTFRGREKVSLMWTTRGMNALSNVNAPYFYASCWLMCEYMQELNALTDDNLA